jgi:hypothetical protein
LITLTLKQSIVAIVPLTSDSFSKIYATYKGDRRASDDNYFSYFDRKAVLFPSSEQMVYMTLEDLKAKIKDIITRRFRN